MSSHAVGSEKIAGGAAGQRPLGGEQGQGAVGGRRRKERQARRNHEILGDKTKKLHVDWKQNWQNSGIGVADFRNEPKPKVTLQSDFSGTPITSFCHAIITK